MTKESNQKVGQAQMPEDAVDTTIYTRFMVDKLTQNEITLLKTKLEHVYNKEIIKLFVDAFENQKSVDLYPVPVKDHLVQYKNNKIFVLFPEVYKHIHTKLFHAVLDVFIIEYPHIFPLEYGFWVGCEGDYFRRCKLHAPKKSIH